MNAKKMQKTFWRFWKSWGRELAIVIGIMIPFRSSIADWNHVPTGSMKPTILECERVFVNKLAYDLKIPLTTWHLAKWGSPGRGDIVVFNSPANGLRLVKRVVGLSGDVVEMRNNRLIVNGNPAEYSSLDENSVMGLPPAERAGSTFATESIDGVKHAVMTIPAVPARRSFGPVTVPQNQYLMLGDNRDNSADSRFFGFVDRNAIVGKVSFVIASFDRDHFYLPRFSRWFTRI